MDNFQQKFIEEATDLINDLEEALFAGAGLPVVRLRQRPDAGPA